MSCFCRMWRAVALASCLGLAQPALAAESAVNLQQAVEAMLAWHPDIAAARARLEEQQHRERVARSGYYPQLSGGVRTGYEGNSDKHSSSQSLNLSLSQMLYDFGEVRSEVAAEEAQLVHQQAGLLQVVEDNLQQTGAAVYEVWRNQKLEDMAYQQQEALQELASLVEQRNLQGAASRSDVAQSKSRVEAAHTQLLHYRNQKVMWQNRLASLLGRQQAVAVSEQPAPVGRQLCGFGPDQVDASPRMRMAKASRDSAEATVNKADARTLPSISLDPTVTRYTKTPDWKDNDRIRRTEYGVFLNVNMPLYQGGALSAERKLARASQLAAESEIAAERQRLLEILFTSQSRREVFDQHSKVLQLREQLSLETRSLYRQQYLEMGSRPLLDLLNAEQEIYQARFEQINVDADTQLVELACINGLGRLHELFGLTDKPVQGALLER